MCDEGGREGKGRQARQSEAGEEGVVGVALQLQHLELGAQPGAGGALGHHAVEEQLAPGLGQCIL